MLRQERKEAKAWTTRARGKDLRVKDEESVRDDRPATTNGGVRHWSATSWTRKDGASRECWVAYGLGICHKNGRSCIGCI